MNNSTADQFYENQVHVTPNRAREIELQSKKKRRIKGTPVVKIIAEKKKRITEYKAHKIFTRKKLLKEFARGLLNPARRPLRNPDAAVAACRNSKQKGKKLYAATYGVTVEDCGLYIDEDNPFLCAKPSGIVRPNGDDPAFLVAVTAPRKARYSQSMTEAFRDYPKQFVLEMDGGGNFQLRKENEIYLRIQMQLQCSKLDICKLIVYLDGLPRPAVPQQAAGNVSGVQPGALAVLNRQDSHPSMEVVVVNRDARLMEEQVLPKLRQFYFGFLLPEIANPQPPPPPQPEIEVILAAAAVARSDNEQQEPAP